MAFIAKSSFKLFIPNQFRCWKCGFSWLAKNSSLFLFPNERTGCTKCIKEYMYAEDQETGKDIDFSPYEWRCCSCKYEWLTKTPTGLHILRDGRLACIDCRHSKPSKGLVDKLLVDAAWAIKERFAITQPDQAIEALSFHSDLMCNKNAK